MLRSHRFALVAAVTLFGVTACGGDPGSTTSRDSLTVIRIGAGGSADSISARPEGASSDKMMAYPYQVFNFVYDGEVPTLGSSGAAWQLPVGGELDTARVARMAQVLGVEGEVREVPAEQGGGWMVGAADYSTANLNVSKDGLLSWWFNPDPSVWGSGTVTCAEPVEAVAESGGGDSGGGETAPPDSVVDTIVIDPVCEEPAPPVGVPSEDEALAKARQLFADLGYDVVAYDFEAYADEWSAYVTAYLLIDGIRSPLTLSVGYGAEGVLTWASGALATPQDAGAYPLVSVQAGIDRLNEEGGYWMGYYGPAGAMVKAASDTAVSDAGGSSEPAAAPETVPSETISPDTVPTDSILVDPPVCDPAADCIDTTLPPEEITVHLSGVQLSLTMVWDVDGTVWLVPAYTFSAADGGEFTVIAVDEQFVTLPDPGLTPEPLPADDPGATVVVDLAAAADLLVGVTEDEASKLAEQNGWTMRVVRRDGEDLAVTDDYSESRVNVAVEAGVVLSVDFVG